MKIAIDIDEVVAKYLDCYCSYHNYHSGEELKPHHFRKFSFSYTLGIPKETSHGVRKNFMESDHFDEMALVEGAEEAINFLSENHEIVFITARPKDHEFKTINFFKKYFPEKNFKVIFSGDYFMERHKDEICRELGIGCIIEDSEDSQNYAKNGIKVILLNRPWNYEVSHENVVRCNDWKEILNEVENLSNGN